MDKSRGTSQGAARTAKKIAVAAMFIGLGVLFISARYGLDTVSAATIGCMLGGLNTYTLFISVLKCLGLTPEQAQSLMVRRYPTRFILTAVVMIALLWQLELSPIALMGGFVVTFMASILAMAVAFRRFDEFSSEGGEAGAVK